MSRDCERLTSTPETVAAEAKDQGPPRHLRPTASLARTDVSEEMSSTGRCRHFARTVGMTTDMTRWLGRVLADRPQIGLATAAEIADALAAMDGTAPGVARSRLSLHLRRAGLRRAAEIAAKR